MVKSLDFQTIYHVFEPHQSGIISSITSHIYIGKVKFMEKLLHKTIKKQGRKRREILGMHTWFAASSITLNAELLKPC